MPRPQRIHVPGALYHTIARGNGGQKTFLDQRDYQTFIDALSDVKRKTPFVIYAYCLMPNHFHLLIEAKQLPLSGVMQRLLTRYVKRFQLRHRRNGHLFQARYKAILCQKDGYLQELVRYLHLNPVRAKLVTDPAKWVWSSHREYLGQVGGAVTDGEFVLSLFHKNPGTSRKVYARFVYDGMKAGHNEEYYPSPSTPYLGNDRFIETYRERLSQRQSEEWGRVELVPLERLASRLKAKVGLEMLRAPTQARKATAARREFVLNAVTMGHRPSAIAAYLHCSPSAISKIVARSL